MSRRKKGSLKMLIRIPVMTTRMTVMLWSAPMVSDISIASGVDMNLLVNANARSGAIPIAAATVGHTNRLSKLHGNRTANISAR